MIRIWMLLKHDGKGNVSDIKEILTAFIFQIPGKNVTYKIFSLVDLSFESIWPKKMNTNLQ